MLPATSRIRRGTEFSTTMKRGRRARRGAVVVHLAARTDAAICARAGFIVSKAVGGAVVRNRVKRRLRHLVAERIDAWPRDMDVVVRALPAAARAPYRELAHDVDAAVAAAGRSRRR